MNLNNLNQLARVQSSLWALFTPTDAPVWISNLRSQILNFESITNTWGVVENSATQLTLTATAGGYDMYLNWAGLAAGINLVVKVWVKLGTAANFCMCVNNAASWGNSNGLCFTTSNGLVSGQYVQISFPFQSLAGGTGLNLHIGSHGVPGLTQQAAGTVSVYGWQIFLVGTTTTTLETNLVVDGSVRCTSLTNSGGYTGQTGSFTSLSVAGVNVGSTLNTLSTYPSVQALTAVGSIGCLSVQASGTSTFNGPVNCNSNFSVTGSTTLAVASFTSLTGGFGSFGQLYCTSLDMGALYCTSLNCPGTGSFNALTVGATNVGTTLATLTNRRTSGTLSATSTFQTIYTMPDPTGNPLRAFVTASSSLSYPNSITCFFEWSTSWPCLTQIAQSGNAQQANLSSSNVASAGTQLIFMQQNGTTGQIQVKVTTATAVTWWVTFL